MDTLGLDHVEFYVSDLDDAVSACVRNLGLVPSARNRELGEISTGTSLSLWCGSCAVVLTAPSTEPADTPDHDSTGIVASYLERHGAGVANICLRVANAGGIWDDAIARGAEPVAPPTRNILNGEWATTAAVRAFGDVRLTFVERSRRWPTSPFGFVELEAGTDPAATATAGWPGLEGIDHLAVCLPAGELSRTADFYTDVLGFVRSFEERVAISGQAMDSIVVQDQRGALVLTLLSQDPDRKPGQISRFVDSHCGAGVQHVAFRTGDIVGDVERLRQADVDFLAIPPTYYERLFGEPDADEREIAQLEQAGVLRDSDPWGTILQAFTRSRHPRETLFFELVERRGARTFGSGNIKALYEAVGRVEPVDSSVVTDSAE